MQTAPLGQTANYVCHVFDAREMTVVAGANTGDPVGGIGELCLGDVYELTEDGIALQLFVTDRAAEAAGNNGFLGQAEGRATVARGSDAGQSGDQVTLDARLTFIAPDGERAELLLIGLYPPEGEARRYFLPLSPLEPGLEYTLIAASEDPGRVELADVTSVAFTRGTLITMADGTQRAVESLHPGDPVLTRGNGPQPVRHVIHRTLRAVGAFAPVAIPKGTLGNAGDLIISQHQRLFLYQRGPARIVKTAEMLVRARDLVDGETVVIRKGGFADYVSLVFDRHEVIYAECIPAESLLVNETTKRQLPDEARAALEARLPDLSQVQLRATEAPSAAMQAARARLLKPWSER